MGCAPSIGARDEDEAPVFAAPPPIPVHIGHGISTRPQGHHTILFIFGGPGSQKGLITEELISQYDFCVISVEEIVLSYLPNKVSNSVTTTADIQDLLKKDAGILSLDWILTMIGGRVASSMHQRYVIDIVPGLNSILKSESFSSEGHSRSMDTFERLHPVMCALELNVSDERALAADKGVAKENDKPDKDRKELSKEMKTFLKGIDEADKGRLEKRLDAYNRAASPFLSYFSESDRLVRIDLLTPTVPNLISTLNDLMHKLKFTRKKPSPRVVLLAASETDLEQIDLIYYNLRKVFMRDIVRGNEDSSLEEQVRAIRKYVHRTGIPKEHFAIVLNSLHLNDTQKTRKTFFVEERELYLDEVIEERKSGRPFTRARMHMKVVTVSDDETLVFLNQFPTKLAKRVSHLWGNDRPSSGTPEPRSISAVKRRNSSLTVTRRL